MSAQFDPALWIVLPSGAGIPRDSLRPCGGCGERRLRVVAYRPGRFSVGCPRCVAWAKDERTIGWLDAGTGELRLTEGG